MANQVMTVRGEAEVVPRKKTVTLYTVANCNFCLRTKALLDQYKIAYVECPLDSDEAQRQLIIQRSGGRTALPQLFIDGRHIGGYFELKRYCEEGMLAVLLAPR